MRVQTAEYNYLLFRPTTREFHNKAYHEVYKTFNINNYELVDVGPGSFEYYSTSLELLLINEGQRLLNNLYTESKKPLLWGTGNIIVILPEGTDKMAVYYDDTPVGIFSDSKDTTRCFNLIRMLDNSEADANDAESVMFADFFCKQVRAYREIADGRRHVEAINYYADMCEIPLIKDVEITA